MQPEIDLPDRADLVTEASERPEDNWIPAAERRDRMPHPKEMPVDGRPRIPLAVKLVYTAFVAVLVPYYWVTYTPWNFLFFCDVALLMALVALWREDSLLASIPAVGITLPQLLWVLDLLAGGRVVGMTTYMFDPK